MFIRKYLFAVVLFASVSTGEVAMAQNAGSSMQITPGGIAIDVNMAGFQRAGTDVRAEDRFGRGYGFGVGPSGAGSTFQYVFRLPNGEIVGGGMTLVTGNTGSGVSHVDFSGIGVGSVEATSRAGLSANGSYSGADVVGYPGYRGVFRSDANAFTYPLGRFGPSR